MSEDTTTSNPPKIRHAELISPPNTLKEKIGSGGIDEDILNKAQESLDNNQLEFEPVAEMLIETLKRALHDAKVNTVTGEPAIEAMIYPAVQLKAQGAMFQYPLITEISNTLVNLLETIPVIDNDVVDLINVHRTALNVVISQGMKGDGGATGQQLRMALMDACNRYYKSRAAKMD